MQRGNNILGNKSITFSALALVIFGSIMIASAEMGNSVGDANYLTGVIVRQVIYAVAGLICYFSFMHIKLNKLKTKYFYSMYVILAFVLLSCLAFGSTNGAYAWIRIGSFGTIQPSEFAKVFMIMFGAKLMGTDHKERNINSFIIFVVAAFIYFIIIAFIQHDFGSAVVLFTICYCIAMIPPYKELRKIQRYMSFIVIGVIVLIVLLLSNPVTELMKSHSDNYMIGRFLAAADPFLYRFDNGYHVIMSLVSFANGGIFGLGYGNSIHKYMNFPNPSNDFILPVIVEELGIIGFAGFVIAYCFLLIPIIRASLKTKYISSKMIFLGVFTYFIVHFILNVGGVSALIPLTGVPLLLISSGGSSLVASLMGLGFAQCELNRNRKKEDENNSREVQENAN